MEPIVLGERLKTIRKLKGFTQIEVAKHLKIDINEVSMWETGKSMPDVAMLVELSDLYQESADSLLGTELRNKTPVDTENTDPRITEALEIMRDLPDNFLEDALSNLRSLASLAEKIRL